MPAPSRPSNTWQASAYRITSFERLVTERIAQFAPSTMRPAGRRTAARILRRKVNSGSGSRINLSRWVALPPGDSPHLLNDTSRPARDTDAVPAYIRGRPSPPHAMAPGVETVSSSLQARGFRFHGSLPEPDRLKLPR